jgi:hypothetical protein
MLAKLLLTLAVILVALVYLQKRRIARMSAGSTARPDSEGPGMPRKNAPDPKADGIDYRVAAWLFLALMLGAAGTMSTLHWQDANKEISVLLHRDGNTDPVVYRVLKKNLSQRSFTTIDGVLVTVSASERMEVIGL